jgi:hypothetical protein
VGDPIMLTDDHYAATLAALVARYAFFWEARQSVKFKLTASQGRLVRTLMALRRDSRDYCGIFESRQNRNFGEPQQIIRND